jgi:endoglucanase
VIVAGMVQEETNFLGARTSAHRDPPTVALVIDTTYGRSHGMAEHLTFPLGGGPSNGWGPAAHPAVHERLRQAAERLEIPLTLEPMPWYSGSDADALQLAGAGVPTGCLFIPVRYMHSPSRSSTWVSAGQVRWWRNSCGLDPIDGKFLDLG